MEDQPEKKMPGRHEPPSAMREFSALTRSLFVSLVNEGFTEAQALELCKSMIVTQLGLNNGEG